MNFIHKSVFQWLNPNKSTSDLVWYLPIHITKDYIHTYLLSSFNGVATPTSTPYSNSKFQDRSDPFEVIFYKYIMFQIQSFHGPELFCLYLKNCLLLKPLPIWEMNKWEDFCSLLT